MDSKVTGVPKALVALAVAVGVAAGSYGVASAATGSSPSSSSSDPAAAAVAARPAPPDPQNPWGGQRSDETLLTGDTAAKVKAAAKAKVPNGTIVRVETDADGHAKYEAHVQKADGSQATVYVNDNFEVVGVESR